MNALDLKKPLQQRITACAVIAAVHAGLFLVLISARPGIVAVIKSVPIHADFIAEDQSLPEPWVPPAPDIVPLTVTTNLPDAPPVELPFAPAERAITVAPRPSAAASPPARTGAGDAPKLVSAVEYVRPPVPHYPQTSRRQREQGTVVLRVLIDARGHAARIEVHQSSGYARLDHAAREAVARAEFKPYVENGLVQAAFVLIPIEFSLNPSSTRRS